VGLWLVIGVMVGACGGAEPDAPPALPYVAPSGDAPVGDVLTAPPTHGQTCTDTDQCGDGRCYCSAPIGPGGGPATGFCYTGRVQTNVWWCLVEDGRVLQTGVIVPG
jgi:hypothetical protein